jgi:hypothetical protein
MASVTHMPSSIVVNGVSLASSWHKGSCPLELPTPGFNQLIWSFAIAIPPFRGVVVRLSVNSVSPSLSALPISQTHPIRALPHTPPQRANTGDSSHLKQLPSVVAAVPSASPEILSA